MFHHTVMHAGTRNCRHLLLVNEFNKTVINLNCRGLKRSGFPGCLVQAAWTEKPDILMLTTCLVTNKIWSPTPVTNIDVTFTNPKTHLR